MTSMGRALVLILFDAEPPGPEACAGDQGETDEDEHFAAIQVVDGTAVQVGIGEDAVDEDQGRGDINEVVEELPLQTTDLLAVVGSDQDDNEEVSRDGSDGVFEWLERRVNGENDVGEPEAVAVHEEQDQRVNHNGTQERVAGPVVEGENVEPAMRPESNGAVADGNENPEQHVGGRQKNGC